MGAEEVSLALLGRFAAHVAGAAVDEQAWRLRKARTLVKLLALEPGRRLHREQAMDLLWPELDASAAQNNLHQALHAARRVLGADSLTLADAMLGLDAAVVCDVDAFERAAAEARRTTDTSAYRDALDLYGGELLPEDRYEPWVDARRAALRELHGTLCLELAALESPEEAVLTLQRAIAADPLHERAHRALMESYEQLGRRQDALAQYHRLHAALQQTLEAAPDEETRLLYRRLLAAGPADTASPLPVQLTTFVGRERELHDVGELLAGGRLVTLTGSGGCGKTRLAIATAERARDGYADGVCFVELGGISDPELVAEATATAVGIRVPSRRTAVEAVAAHWRRETRFSCSTRASTSSMPAPRSPRRSCSRVPG